MGIIQPRQIVLVTSRHESKDNIITIGWHTRVSSNPELYAFALSKRRHSYGMIKDSRCFAVNFVPPEAEDDAEYCGTNSGRNVDKFEKLGIVKDECEKIDCPTIRGAAAIMECKLIHEIDFKNSSYVLFIGEVVSKKLIKEGKRLLWSDGKYMTTSD